MQFELLEGVRQQQQFALRIERAALHAPGVPGGADLDAAVGGIDVHIGSHAGDLAVGVVHRERQHRAGREQAEAAVDFLFHVFGGRDEGVPELPQLAVADGFDQSVDVIVRQRLQPRVRALKGNRFKKGHRNSPLATASLRGAQRSNPSIRVWRHGLLRCARNDETIITCSKNSAPAPAAPSPSRSVRPCPTA